MKVFLITSARSGSHHLLEHVGKSLSLDKEEYGKGVEVLNELFFEKSELPQGLNSVIKTIDDSNRNICSILSHQFIGCDLKLFQLANHYKDSKFIVLNRVNKLDQYFSSKLAFLERNWLHNHYETKFALGLDQYYKYATESISYAMLS